MRVCEVEACVRKHIARGMCDLHYQVWRLNSGVIVLPACAFEGCDKPRRSLGYCGSHAKNLRNHGSPQAPDRKGRNHPKWAGSTPTYGGAHWRVRNRYGSPRQHYCAGCGGTAREWAYDHLDPDELIHHSPKGDIPYSANPAYYIALCKSCHTHFDNRHIALTRVTP